MPRHALWRFLLREQVCRWRRLGDVLSPWLFFMMVMILFPLALPPDPRLLHTFAPGIVWVAALLSSLMVGSRFFRDEYHSGVLLQWCVSGQPLSILVFMHVMVACVVNTVMLMLLLPIVMMLFSLSWEQTQCLALGLALGMPTLFCMNAFVASLTVNVSSSAVLLALLVLPLCMPILIWGAGACAMAEQSLSMTTPLAMMAAMSVVCVVLAPLATASALRTQVT